jgi:hypothetical protein
LSGPEALINGFLCQFELLTCIGGDHKVMVVGIKKGKD